MRSRRLTFLGNDLAIEGRRAAEADEELCLRCRLEARRCHGVRQRGRRQDGKYLKLHGVLTNLAHWKSIYKKK